MSGERASEARLAALGSLRAACLSACFFTPRAREGRVPGGARPLAEGARRQRFLRADAELPTRRM